MKEREVERLLGVRVRELGGLSFKLAPTHVGMPDRLVLLPGGVLHLVEVKADDGRLDPAQRLWHKRAADLGVVVIVVRGAAEARNFLAEGTSAGS